MITVTPQEIRAALLIKGITQISIARNLGVAPSLVSMVIHQTEKNSEIRKAIAKAIDKPYKEVWKKSS